MFCFKVLVSILIFGLVYSDEDNNDDNGLIDPQPRIKFGYYDNITKHPYMARLDCILNTTTLQGSACVGSIISENWILTAAHCLADCHYVLVYVGSDNFNGYTDSRNTTLWYNHDYYNPATALYSNDIGLLYVKSLRLTDTVNIIPLWGTPEYPPFDTRAVVCGWGQADKDNRDPRLKCFSGNVDRRSTCEKLYNIPSELSDYYICVDGGYSKVMQGDSGAPAIIQGHLAGVLSTGLNTSGQNPAVYVHVPFYSLWIQEVTYD